MNTTQRTARPRAAAAVEGALAARKRLALTAVLARQLDQIAPGTAQVRTVPVNTDRDGEQRLATWVVLDDALGLPIEADRAAHTAARRLLRAAFPAADWTRPHTYDAATGDLALDAPTLPEELHR
ncbi:hypothetical protein SEA_DAROLANDSTONE_34 [Streptomyces phage Darolandstone]|uniref:Uncharacterized protein n=1 Tax=Streptomyces phage Darolandstone TaxID=2315716 RepID=A0A386KKQ0_9CAUD|nr:hypothetical protein HOU27_gp34 [Streptomyces phage Darolandstone]AYD86225.1 hypothetical protein SEA_DAROLANDSTONE_34 [Streptomyces phage Darolandstone]